VSGTAAAGFQSSTKTYQAKHFNLQTKTRPTTVAGVTFQQSRRIQGSQNWQGQNYWAFRNYRPVWHERNWWNSHYSRVVFVYGGWYYWNAGWWYPAWGYAPNAYYAYDGPIYAYNDLPPDQVVANVQTALQEQGYYDARVDGLLGPRTRAAVADYQRDHGLYVTSAIDQPTLQSLGMA
jgi:putative peptidoglycan binding protein